MRRLGIYLLILILLVAFYYLHEERRGKERRQEGQKLFTFDPKAVDKLLLENSYGKFEFVRRGKKWWINRPIKDFADSYKIGQIIDNFASTEIRKKIYPLPSDLGPYGLKEPRFKVSIFSKKGTYLLSLGEDTPNHAHIYSMTKERKAIYLLPIHLKYLLNKDIGEFRDKAILDFDPQKVKRISLGLPKEKVVLVKGKSWQILTPFKEAADQDEVEDFLYHIRDGRALNFIKTHFRPKVNIEIWVDEEKEPLWLKIGRGEKVYVKSSYHPDEMVVEDTFLKDLPKSAMIFKRRYIFNFDKESVSKIEIQFGNKKLFCKKEKKWKITPTKLAKDYEIEFFLSDLKNLKYLPENIKRPKGLSSPLAGIKLWDKNGKKIVEAKCFKGNKDICWIETNNKFYPIKSDFFESFPEKLKEVKDGKGND